MLDGDFFTPEYLLSPGETNADITEADEALAFTGDNVSYAVLRINTLANNTKRTQEWRNSLNTQAIVLGDRATGGSGYTANTSQLTSATATADSIWSEEGDGDWKGSLTRNDNSTSFENDEVFDDLQYSNGAIQTDDNIFHQDTDEDCVLLFNPS